MKADRLNESYGKIIKDLLSFQEDMATHEEIRDRITSHGKVTGIKLCILCFATLIICAGLSLNSISGLIGAMLITEIFGSIQAMAYGTVSADWNVVKKYLIGLLMQVFVSLIVSTVYFLILPINETTSEIIRRIKTPNYDVIIASCSALIGILGYTRKVKASSVIYGATIAVILLPPLCICGYSISRGETEMLMKAAYSFGVNSYVIFLFSSLILTVMRVPKMQGISDQQWKKLRGKMIRNTILSIIPAVLIAYGVLC